MQKIACRLLLIALIFAPLKANAQDQSSDLEYVAGLEVSEEHSQMFSEYLALGLNRRHSYSDVEDAERKLPPNVRQDPAFQYGKALVLLKHRQTNEAVMLLEKLCEQTENHYLPSWKAYILHHLKTEKYSTGYKYLEDLVDLLKGYTQQENSSIDAEGQLEWVGLVFGGLDYQLKSKTLREEREEVLERIQSKLSDDLQAALERGLQSAVQLHDEILAQADQQIGKNAIEQAEQNEVTKENLKDKEELLKKEQEALKLTAEEWEKKMLQYQKAHSETIKALERQFQTLELTRSRIAGSITNAQIELTDLQRQRSNFRDKNGKPVRISSDPAFTAILRRINNCQRRLNTYQGQYNQVTGQMRGVYGQATQANANFQGIVRDYQNATGNLFKQDKAIGKQFSKLQKEAQDVRDSKPTGETAETKKLRRIVGYLTTYVVLDPETEGERLILAHLPNEPSTDE